MKRVEEVLKIVDLRDRADDPVRTYSYGMRQRLGIAQALLPTPEFIILDEPTNDLDIQTLTILEDYLELFPGAVITVSHDRYFLDRSCDHLFAFEGEDTIRHFYGNYTDYLVVDGQVKAEVSPGGDWSDYIYFNGRLLLRVDGWDDRIRTSGGTCLGCTDNWSRFSFANAG